MLTNPPIPYNLCVSLPISCLLTTFNQEKALVGAFSVIVKTDGLFYSTRTVWTADSDDC